MRKSLIGIILLSIVIVGIALPIGFSAQSDTKVITYGETTYNNANYKSIVDNFFNQQAKVDVKNIESKIISAGEVNKVASTITGKTYTSGQIFSSALVDLSEQGNIKVTVDKSKITTITAEMYISALKSAGITHGHVYVTSPVSATGESALTGIMNSYEAATDVQIPETVKQAANEEIYTEAEIVEKDNVTADQLTKLVDDVKDTVQKDNITDHKTIVNIIYNYTVNNNINMTNSSIENLATSIGGVQAVQGDVQNYTNKVTEFVGNNAGGFSLNDVLGKLGI
ncbi:MAG: DUF1002 domain-containing protein [Methanobrevibacter sp.]|uniref:DUF1002 domain-containing protein n=1 Tax=Methanobrevibacter millerae TaxID=230361 RepID=A0A8T3VDN0_9EURY|nr:DUF1002 domain-containing protein [Methanobrevibacter millerae]MBE6505847.1 DUF1002 domain-containing protein [Methanobrevibacter millerae]MBR0057798.1 DUF1002 domain-containing protein [Methanobrevibacter sp.]MBR0369798.1 DUF1002 domain-containing protein [Methanobrevibacter sp.]